MRVTRDDIGAATAYQESVKCAGTDISTTIPVLRSPSRYRADREAEANGHTLRAGINGSDDTVTRGPILFFLFWLRDAVLSNHALRL